MNNIKKNPILIKILYALIIALIAITCWSLIGWLDDKLSAKIIGFILYLSLISYALYEYAKILPLPKWTRYYFALLSLISFFSPWDDTHGWFLNSNSAINIIRKQYEYQLFGIPGLGFLAQAILVLIPFLFNKNNLGIKNVWYYFISYIVVIVFTITGKSILIVNGGSPIFILILFIGPIICDTFAYFGGLLFGNKIFSRKLAPRISPNKTIEGAISGYIMTWLILFLIFYFADFRGWGLKHVDRNILLIVVPLTLPIVAIIGDLSFSWIKRFVKIKDFSNIIPGHGGILDRIDSVSLVCFVYLTIFIFV